MQINYSYRKTVAGFSLMEALIGIVVVGVVVGALYTGFTQGVLITQMTREDSRASQILLEKSEALRLCGWDTIISNGVPENFTAYYDPHSKNSGAVYNGRITIIDATVTPTVPPVSYKKNLKEVRIRVNWKTGNVSRRRELTTFVARYGLQTYVY